MRKLNEEPEEVSVQCPVCHHFSLPPALQCSFCGVLREESKEVAVIREEMQQAGFWVPPYPHP